MISRIKSYFLGCLLLLVNLVATLAIFGTELPKVQHAEIKDCMIEQGSQKTFPDCVGLPLEIGTAVIIDKVEKIDESAETFVSSFDLILRWNDPRLRFEESIMYGVRKDYMAQEAIDQVELMWTPRVLFANLSGELKNVDNAISLHADGSVVWSRRFVGTFRSEYDLNNFPFDDQKLRIQMIIESLPSRTARFVHRDMDRRRSILASTVHNDPIWNFKDLEILVGETRTINGDSASRLEVSFVAIRYAGAYVPQVFLPLIVTILLPLLGLWVMNTEIHERINWSITGVFSLIALNFSVNLQYPALGPDSLVMQFFWIGYGLQFVMFMVLLLIYNLPISEILFSRWVHDSILQWMRWAIPTMTVTMMAWAMVLAIL